MAYLHPDKLVGAARAAQAIQSRPQRVKPNTEKAAMRAASKPKALTPQKSKADRGLMEQLAFRLRDAHWNNHLDRLARNVDAAVANAKPAKKSPAVAKAKQEIKPFPIAPVRSGNAPVVTLTIGAGPPR